MQIRIKRLIAAAILGLALALGAVASNGLIQHETPVQVADPGGHSGGTGGI